MTPHQLRRFNEMSDWIRTFRAAENSSITVYNDNRHCIVGGGGGRGVDNGKPGLNGGSPNWFRITAHSQITPNRWQYTGAPQVPDRAGKWRGPTGSVGGITLYNTLEVNNEETGILGSGDNATTLPGGTALLPIGVGAVVPAWPVINCNGVLEFHFAVPNNVGGDCQEPS